MSDSELFSLSTKIEANLFSLEMVFNIWLVVLIAAIVVITLKFKFISYLRFTRVRPSKIELSFPGGKTEFSIESNHKNLEIAHKIYIELVTRKAAVEIDEDHDVIVEIYDSWYSLFKTTRNEIKDISGSLLDHPDSKGLVKMATSVLNKGLRPHLTEYQARFRRWYENELSKVDNEGLSPQQIQKKYPDYDELMISIKQVNELLMDYAKQLDRFIYFTQ